MNYLYKVNKVRVTENTKNATLEHSGRGRSASY